ncbi:MAG: hypothetical protein ACT4OO_16120 [Nitrospiraceae bacterium]
MEAVQFRHTFVPAVAGALWLCACATEPRLDGNPNQQAMVGTTKEQVFACAGQPLKQVTDQEITLLRYYREAPMLEESFVASKGSRSGIHRGCWATVVLEHDRVSEVIYRFAPSSVDASNDCEEIFEPCVQ